MEKTSPEKIAKESSELAATGIEKASTSAHATIDQATEAALSATERISAASANIAAGASRLTEATREQVRRNPFASIGVAVGVALGMVAIGAGWFFRRERWTNRHTHAH